jgi:hypothetical protein
LTTSVQRRGEAREGSPLGDLANDRRVDPLVPVAEDDRSIAEPEVNKHVSIGIRQLAAACVLDEHGALVAPESVILSNALRHVLVCLSHQPRLLITVHQCSPLRRSAGKKR